MSNEFIDPELENWVDSQQKFKGSWRRVSVLGCAILMASALIALIYPKASLYFKPTLDCGDITTRPERKKSERIKLNHNTFCNVRGVVSDLRVFSTEQDVDGPNKKPTKIPPIEKLDDVRSTSLSLPEIASLSFWMRRTPPYTHIVSNAGATGFGL